MSVEAIWSVCLGIGLAAACGFRVFLPFFALGLAARFGSIELAHAFDWLATDAALITLGVATVVEIAAYYIPWVDNALDSISSPAAVAAGVLATAAVLTDFEPAAKWTIAAIAGGGAAGAVQALTVGARKLTLLTTGGIANPIVATIELAGSAVMSLISIVVPALALAVVVGLVAGSAYVVSRVLRRRKRAA